MKSKIDKIITEVLKKAKSKKRDVIENTWFEFLSDELSFPFQAEVNLYSYSKALKDGDIVKVIGIDSMIDMYGIILKTRKGRETLYIPLVELEVIEKTSENAELFEAFLTWDGNE